MLEQKRTDTETKNELRERIDHLEQKFVQTQGGFYKAKSEHLPHLKGFQFVQESIGDGKCLKNCLALKLYQNQNKAFELKRKLNNHVVDNLDTYYANKISFPYKETVGVGINAEKVVINNKKEMKDFLRSEKSLKTNSNGHEIIAIANLFKIRINIFTFKKEECYWSFISPDPDFVSSSNMESQNVSDLFLYHSYNNH